MRVSEIKKHFEEKGKYLIKNNHFVVSYLGEIAEDILSIFLSKYSLHYLIYDDINHEKVFAISLDNIEKPYYCDLDAVEEFVRMIDKWIDDQNELLSYVETINKETIVSKLRRDKIGKIIGDIDGCEY